MIDLIEDSWRATLTEETRQPYFAALQKFVAEEREQHTIFPPEAEVFAALTLTPIDQVRVLILGQDPYHDDHQAHGLCFSVQAGVAIPPSLSNIFKELKRELNK